MLKKRRILLIHEQNTFRDILKRTLTAEVPDVDLHTAWSAREALDRLDTESFDMVISANEMEFMNGTGIYEKMKSGGRNAGTSFLLLTSSLDEKNRQLFKEKRIEHVLQIPFKAGELSFKVESLSHPRIWRQHQRFEIPGIVMRIQLDNKVVQADLVNISLGGALANLNVKSGDIPEFSRYYKLNISFPETYERVSVNAEGYVIRQAALQWLEPPRLEIIQGAWRLANMGERELEVLGGILDKAAEHLEPEE